MSEHILNQESRLNDSMERTIMNKALSNGETVSIVTLSKNTFKFLKHSLSAVFTFMVELAEEINKVRAESERYSRTRW